MEEFVARENIRRFRNQLLVVEGARVTIAESMFVGWFGPRGLASVVFAIMVFDAQLPGNIALMATVAWTVVLSVIAHGLTANTFARLLAMRPQPGRSS